MVKTKTKGTQAERDLIHKFWEIGFAAIRAAGSGNTSLPSPDLLVSNGTNTFAIECKTFKKNNKYFEQQEIEQLQNFADIFGAQPIIAIKFNYKPWYFLRLEDLKKTNTAWAVSLNLAEKKGLQLHHFQLENQKI